MNGPISAQAGAISGLNLNGAMALQSFKKLLIF
jgi:hypothetical protein